MLLHHARAIFHLLIGHNNGMTTIACHGLRGLLLAMVWIVVVVEMAQITPPIGFNLFVFQGMTGHQINYIALTALPLFLLMVLIVAILVMFPELATWLPDQVRTAPGG